MRHQIGALTLLAAGFVLASAGCGTGTQQQTDATVSVPQPSTGDAMTQPTNETSAPNNGTMMAKTDITAAAGVATKTDVKAGANDTGINAVLKTQLEASYADFVKILAAGDKSGFLMIMDPNKTSPVPTDDQWKQALPQIQSTFPALSETQFVAVEQKSESRAYYYYLTDLDDKNYTSVNVAIFNKVDGVWKISGNIFSSGFAKSSDTTKEKEAIAKAKASLRLKADAAK